MMAMGEQRRGRGTQAGKGQGEGPGCGGRVNMDGGRGLGGEGISMENSRTGNKAALKAIH